MPLRVNLRKVLAQHVGDLQQELAPAVRKGSLTVNKVRHGSCAGSRVGAVLPPEQKLDRVPSGADVGLAAAAVVKSKDGAPERWILRRVADDPAAHGTFDGIDVRLVHGPRVNKRLHAATLGINGAVSKAERLGAPIGLASGGPGLPGTRKGSVTRFSAKRLHRRAHRLRCSEGGVVRALRVTNVAAHRLGGDRGPVRGGRGAQQGACHQCWNQEDHARRLGAMDCRIAA